MKLFRTPEGAVVQTEDKSFRRVDGDWDTFLNRGDLGEYLRERADGVPPMKEMPSRVLAPIGSQEVWAAGVTYSKSRHARVQESEQSGSSGFYERVYEARRPELFFKATAHRVVGDGDEVKIRSDSQWNVPEPELVVLLSARKQVLGYTIGIDMSSRDIERENPLYLPQAKIYDRSCALGPGILIRSNPLPDETLIELSIRREGVVVFNESTQLTAMKRGVDELVDFLFCENSFPAGCFLMTGTGIVPPDEFTLMSGDEIRVGIDSIGELRNRVA